MPLKALRIKPGVNRENTRYTTEGGWYESDNVRFRQDFPEKIGGWTRISSSTFLGVCRSLNAWVTLGSIRLTGLGTNLKFYIEKGGLYNDITPIRATVALTDPFTTVSGSAVVTVTDATGGYSNGDFVTFSGASAVGGLTLNDEYQITFVAGTTYTITASANASSSATGGGSVSAVYQINVGAETSVPLTGWSGGTWGAGTWGTGGVSAEGIRLWSHFNFGENLILAYRGGAIYYWVAQDGVGTPAVALAGLAGASNVPTTVNFVLGSDVSRFVFAFGANILGSGTFNPLLVRWSDQENPLNWTPSAVNQAGDIQLSQGSEIVTAIQSRQELLVWTDSALYSMQYVGAPVVWGAQLVGDNTSIVSQNAVAYANGVAFWMGKDKFYTYSGTVKPLRCDLRKFVFENMDISQVAQVCAGTNEAYNEVWWFYCSTGSTVNDSYVIYNYVADIWYYGSIGRTAWIDSGIRDYPLAATYSYNLVNHEEGVDNNETATATAISASIQSSEFDLEDGHQFAFVWRVIPDISFSGSTIDAPNATMTLLPLASSGSGYNSPSSEGGTNTATITRSAVLPIEAFTPQLYTRVRGRQMAMKIESDGLGVQWQLGTPRIDMRPDGRR
jgi:hypothetical protein